MPKYDSRLNMALFLAYNAAFILAVILIPDPDPLRTLPVEIGFALGIAGSFVWACWNLCHLADDIAKGKA